MTIEITSWLGWAILVGFMIPALLTSIIAGMGSFHLANTYIRRTSAGTRMRQAAYRAWPNKFKDSK